MKIFISIPSYRDPELVRTIKSAIDKSSKLHELHFAIIVQDIDKKIPDLSWVPNLKLVTMHPKDAKGAGYARSIAMSLYKDEEYYLQIDSHTIFEDNWDLLCIEEHNKAKEISNNDKIILSYFPPAYHVESNGTISFILNDIKKPPYPTKQKPFLTIRNYWTAKRVEFSDQNRLQPELSSTILAGFVFTTGNIVNEVPYDPEISFFGEEICFAMRAWTRGWDIYSPSKVILHHFYSRLDYDKIWNDKIVRDASWSELEKKSKEKQIRVLCGREKGIFGAGDYRHLKSFERMVGFDFKKMYGLTNQDNDSTIE